MSVEETVEAILAELSDILPLEAWRLAHGWSRPKVLKAFFELYRAEDLPEPSVDTVRLCRWEHGARAVPPDCAHMLSKLYKVSVERLGLQCGCSGTSACPSPTRRRPAVTVRRPRAEDEGADPMRRRTLLAATGLSIPLQIIQRFDDALAVPPPVQRPEGLAEIQQRLKAARHQFDVSDLAGLMAGLPDLLATAKDTAERSGTPAGWALLAASYALATDTLNKVGRTSTARLTADRALLFAERSGDPVALGAAARPLGMMLRKENRFEPAVGVVMRAVDQLEAAGLRTPAQASMYVRLMCAASYTASWAGDRERALERIGETEQAVTRLAGLTGRSTTMPFVRLYRANISYALGDAGMALHVMRDLKPGMYPTPERRARLYTDRARALWQWGKPEETAQALLAAYREAPGEVRDRPNHRQIAEDLAGRYPRVTGVRELTVAISR